MNFPNWTDLTLYHYLGIAGGAIVLIAIVLYFTPVARLKAPAVIVGVFGGLGVGAALGVIAMGTFGFRLEQPSTETAGNTRASDTEARMPPPGMPGRAMMMGGRGAGGGRGPNSKNQLATLVTKLDQLSGKPLALTLSAEQKQKVREQLQKLDDEKELKEDDAKKRLDTILLVVNDQRAVLESAGYRWPGAAQGGGGRPRADRANPFKDEANAHHLKSLRAYLAEKRSTD